MMTGRLIAAFKAIVFIQVPVLIKKRHTCARNEPDDWPVKRLEITINNSITKKKL